MTCTHLSNRHPLSCRARFDDVDTVGKELWESQQLQGSANKRGHDDVVNEECTIARHEDATVTEIMKINTRGVR